MTDESTTLKPSAGKANGAGNAGANSCLEGLNASELKMIHSLAGNDPIVRKRTMRKLRKWLAAIASKIPDSQESRELVDPNFVRVWKALFYCMWMADKPIPQEQLAEQISNLLSIFSRKQNILIIFVDWFFLTVAREWSWIDRFRLDKFMMLIRRFLRKSLEQLSLHNWNKDILKQFVQIISIHIFNRHPPTKKTRTRAKISDLPRAPLGFQIHFTDIFLEELAKVGAETLKSEATLELLSPFIFELAHNDDDRLLTEIRERIFIHLIKQSDAAFDYMEGGIESSDESDEEEMAENDVEDEGIEQEESDGDEEMDYNQPLDPRAGQVDVILPQLQISYDKLADQLVESGGQKDVKGKNKKILFALARSINELTEGRYPLALPESGPRAPAISKKEVHIATERLASLEDELIGNKRKRKNKKERKRELKQLELELPAPKKLKGLDTTVENEAVLPAIEIETPNVSTTSLAISTTPDSPLKKKRVVENKIVSPAIKTPNINSTSLPISTTPDSPSKKKRVIENKVVSSVIRSSNVSRASLPISTTPYLKKRFVENKGASPAKTTVSRASLPIMTTPDSSLKKRVSFVLARNSEHPHSDYQDSIQRSPAIPFDSKKQPNGGLLKAKSPLAKPNLKGYVIPRKKAADFF